MRSKKFNKGLRVRKVGSNICGTITKIEYDINLCKWRNNVPLNIEVLWDDDSVENTDVYKITRKKVK